VSLQVVWGSLEDEFARGLAGRRQAAQSEAGWQAGSLSVTETRRRWTGGRALFADNGLIVRRPLITFHCGRVCLLPGPRLVVNGTKMDVGLLPLLLMTMM